MYLIRKWPTVFDAIHSLVQLLQLGPPCRDRRTGRGHREVPPFSDFAPFYRGAGWESCPTAGIVGVSCEEALVTLAQVVEVVVTRALLLPGGVCVLLGCSVGLLVAAGGAKGGCLESELVASG